MTIVAPGLNQVNAVILERMQSEVSLIPELAGHLIAGGGKRMRPMLTLASARLLDYSGTRHCTLAACVAFIHTAPLLHAGVVDGSRLRRRRRPPTLILGHPASVLAGGLLYPRSVGLIFVVGPTLQLTQLLPPPAT